MKRAIIHLPRELAVCLTLALTLTVGHGCLAPAREEIAMPFRVIAHRGASAYAPENTLSAFETARALGIEEVELDIQLSRDDVVMLFHDDDLSEKAGVSGRIRDYDAKTLARLDIGAWFARTHPERTNDLGGTQLATLREVFETFGDGFVYHIEIKADESELPMRLLAEVQRAGLRERVIATSFWFDQLERTRGLDSEVPLCLLVKASSQLRAEAVETPLAAASDLDLQKHSIDRAVAAGFQQVGFAAEDLTVPLVRYARDRGLEIRAWRIRGEADVERAIQMGADGMTTDWPDLLRDRIEHGHPSAER